MPVRNPQSADDRTPDEPADHLLVQAFLARDERAIELLAGRLEVVPRFVACLNRRFGSAMSADEVADLAQDVTEIALRKLDSFPVGAPLEAWLYRIAGFELCNALRRKRNRATAELPEGLVAGDSGVAEVVERHEMLASAMAELGADAAQVVRLHHFEGLTFVEIGERLDVTTNVIKGRYYRAIERLTDILKRQNAPNAP